MSDKIGDYTKNNISDVPADFNSEAFKKYQSIIPKFLGEAVYIYSFKEQRMLYVHGWEKLLGYEDSKISMLKIVSCTSKRHFNFSNELNDKALKFILKNKIEMEKYSFTLEVEKIHKDGRIIPLFSRVAVYKANNGIVEEIMGVSQIIKSLKISNVMQYAVYGPESLVSKFEETLNRELFNHYAISRKEKEALKLAAKGLTFKEIADAENVSQSAIEKRILPMYKRFKVKSLPHLIHFAHLNHII